MEESRQINVLIVDDHQVVRRGLAAYLELDARVCVVGEAADGGEACEKYERLRPDVVLLDLQMEPIDGLEALRRIRAFDPEARVIVLTSFVDSAHVIPAVEAGANGYLLKTADPDEIMGAVESAMHGRLVYDQVVMRALSSGARDRDLLKTLTEREREVLRLIAKGKSNQDIGEVLYIGLKTVKTHVSNILSKLEVADRTQAAVYALTHGVQEK